MVSTEYLEAAPRLMPREPFTHRLSGARFPPHASLVLSILALYVSALILTEDLAPCCQGMNVFILFAPRPVSKAPSPWVNQMIL